MSVTHSTLSKAEFTERGTAWYERLKAELEPGNKGKIVAIDIMTGAYAVGEDTLSASDLLLASHPTAQTWFARIGQGSVHRFGPRSWRPCS